jgi:hypothetical protein
MIIALDNGMDKLKHELRAAGVMVVGIDESKGHADAYIYNRPRNMDDTCFESIEIRGRTSQRNNGGAVKINAAGKPYSQIKNELLNYIHLGSSV